MTLTPHATAYVFTDRHQRQHASSTPHGAVSRARTYVKADRLRPTIHEVYWDATVEEWRSKHRNDLTERAYAKRG